MVPGPWKFSLSLHLEMWYPNVQAPSPLCEQRRFTWNFFPQGLLTYGKEKKKSDFGKERPITFHCHLRKIFWGHLRDSVG